MRLIIAGSRTFNNYNLLEKEVTKFINNNTDVTILCGMAKGADLLGKRYGEEKGFTVEEYPAN